MMHGRSPKLAFWTVIAAALTLSGIAVWWMSEGADMPAEYTAEKRTPHIKPDYTELTIPPNIAPLNFIVEEPGVDYRVRIFGERGGEIQLGARDAKIVIPQGPWHELLIKNRGGRILIDVYAKNKGGRWTRFDSINNTVAEEEIDSHLVYRLLGPVCNLYYNIGIYQRNLENYDESPILINESFGGCTNCHSFANNRPDRFSLQVRPGPRKKVESGMIVVRDGHAVRVNTQSKAAPKPSTHVVWRPHSSEIAFSMTKTRQFFHGAGIEIRDVYDLESHLAIANLKTGASFTSPEIADPGKMETFPCWSADGKVLYFCSTKRLWDEEHPPTVEDFTKLKYDLMRVTYDSASNSWGKAETILAAAEMGLSICEPKASPDGRYLLLTLCDYGCFPIQQINSDIYLYEIQNGKAQRLECNSNKTDSWHCWSSNSRWIVFSSRRDNGLLARPYFSFIDKEGRAQKPFLLPQKDPAFYDSWAKTYNVPELITGPVTISEEELLRAILAEDATGKKSSPSEPSDNAYRGAN